MVANDDNMTKTSYVSVNLFMKRVLFSVIISALLGVLPTLGQPLGRNLGNPCETHGETLRVTGWPKKCNVMGCRGQKCCN